jgi:AraC-like DNA-binding protein
MDDFFKYLTPSDQDTNWGLFLNVAGKATIKPGIPYPPPDHPTGYNFTWEKGRILNEYQINYVTNGAGIYENKTGKYHIKPGTLLITRPGVWHRYKPQIKTGWIENYIGFNGSIADQILNNTSLCSYKPVIHIGNRGEFIDTYYKIFEYIKDEKPGYQQVCAGMIMKLFGYMVSVEKQKSFSEKRIEQIIQKACFLIRENVDTEFDLKEFAEINSIGYSYFRKMFKKYTGLPPIQYQLDLKIMRGREILLTTNKSVKEISYGLGFQSAYYFSRAFKKKLGVSPSAIKITK